MFAPVPGVLYDAPATESTYGLRTAVVLRDSSLHLITTLVLEAVCSASEAPVDMGTFASLAAKLTEAVRAAEIEALAAMDVHKPKGGTPGMAFRATVAILERMAKTVWTLSTASEWSSEQSTKDFGEVAAVFLDLAKRGLYILSVFPGIHSLLRDDLDWNGAPPGKREKATAGPAATGTKRERAKPTPDDSGAQGSAAAPTAAAARAEGRTKGAYGVFGTPYCLLETSPATVAFAPHVVHPCNFCGVEACPSRDSCKLSPKPEGLRCLGLMRLQGAVPKETVLAAYAAECAKAAAGAGRAAGQQ